MGGAGGGGGIGMGGAPAPAGGAARLGVDFRVCGLAAQDYDYDIDDFYDFVRVVPSAITDLAHWQLEGYALLTPTVMEKNYAIEEIR